VTNITAPAGFSLSATTATISPASSETITVTFSPTEVKSYSGTITITSNATSSANSLSVTGTGIAVVPTYTINIAPIINGNCLNCHQSPPINSAPMSLTTYTDVKNAVQTRGLIGRVENGSMPKNGTPLTTEQIQLIKDWMAGGFIE